MTERPILFSGPMVKTLRAGRKTQTRRIVKPQPVAHSSGGLNWIARGKVRFWNYRTPPDDFVALCPYGVPGDRLWVRETGWERPERTPHMMREGADTWEPYYFDADGLTTSDHEDFKKWGFKRRPAIFMPRQASRITLELKAVRVERLHQISDADCLAEGIEWPYPSHATPSGAYRAVWEAINGKASWDADPFVWVVEFKEVK